MTTRYTTDGTPDGEVDLPAVFETPYRPDLIRRAVLAAQANRKQDQGADPFAGMRTPAESPGSGQGIAHVPRQSVGAAGNQARRVPQAVKGRTAHPPKADTDRTRQINDQERRLAIRSAIAATADDARVRARGHVFDEDLEVPIVVSDDFAALEKTQDVVEFLEAIGAHADVERADDRTRRSGRGTMRGRTYRRPTSILFVTVDGPSRAARNLAGVDVATAASLNAEDLAPGGDPGRLSVWTESALEEVADR